MIDVAYSGEILCQAIPFRIGRHVHPAVPQAEPPEPAKDSDAGLAYLDLVRLADDEEKGAGHIAYREVPLPGFPEFDETREAR